MWWRNDEVYSEYYVVARETGDRIDSFSSEEEALEAIEEYEAEDKEEGTYERNFYEVEEVYMRGGEEVDYEDYRYQLTGQRWDERRFDLDEY